MARPQKRSIEKETRLNARQTEQVFAAWDELSDWLEDPDAGNDEVRDAAIRMCDALNAAYYEHNSPARTARAGWIPYKPCRQLEPKKCRQHGGKS